MEQEPATLLEDNFAVVMSYYYPYVATAQAEVAVQVLQGVCFKTYMDETHQVRYGLGGVAIRSYDICNHHN